MSDVLTTAATTLALTLNEAKAQLNVTSTADDTLITNHIKAATKMLEDRCGRCFVTQTRTLKLHSFEDTRYACDGYIRPPRSPLKSVSSISYVAYDGTTTTMPSSDYSVSTGDQPGVVTPAYGAVFPSVRPQLNPVTITYVAGHSTVSSGVPFNVKQAVGMVVAHFYRNREAVLTGTISKDIEYGVDALLYSEDMAGGYA